MTINFMEEPRRSDFFSKETVVAEVMKNEHTKYLVSVGVRGEDTLINIREFYLKDGEWRAGKSGMATKVDLMKEIALALDHAVKESEHLK